MPTATRHVAATGSSGRRWLAGLAILLVLVTASIMVLSAVGSGVLAGVRAYVGGEGLWSKAQKDAVIALHLYTIDGDESHWADYEAAIEVTLGDSAARQELEKPNPDMAIVERGFLAGRNAPEDVPALANLFRTFRRVSYIDQAIAIWTEGDREIAILREIAGRLRDAVRTGDETSVIGLRAELEAANERLTVLEDAFSRTLGEGARWVQAVLLVGTGAFLVVLLLTAAMIGRYMLRRLRVADERYRHMIGSAADGILVVDAGGRISVANAAAGAMIGADAEALIGRPLDEILSRPTETATDGQAADAAELFIGHRADGTEFPAEATRSERIENGRPATTVVVRDVTDREAAAAALRESEARLRLVMDQLPAVLWTTDRTLRITSIFGEGLNQTGRQPESLLGADVDSLPARPEDRDRRLAAHRAALAGEAAEFTIESEGRQFQVNVQPLVVGTQRVGVIGVAVDMTERLELEARLARSTRMESIGRLAGGIAHDFNNLLTAITGYSELLLGSLPDGDDRRDVEEIRRAAARAGDLTRQLLAFGRRQVLKPELVVPNEVIGSMEQMLDRLIGEHILLEYDRDPAAPSVLADPGQLEQVILNLAVNARDAMPDGGRLTISTRTADRIDAPGGELVESGGPWALISVADTGMGMDEATRSRIFEPFFTTKGQGKGTGLGLATVLGIVEQSGGTIRVSSQPGLGSTFSIYLPAAAHGDELFVADAGVHAAPGAAGPGTEAEGTAADGEQLAAVSLAGKVVLLAEDEAIVRTLVRSVLTSAGMVVVDAVDGEDALVVARSIERIDLLLTDVIMPRLNGRELADRLLGMRPGLPVLFMTGYSGGMLGERQVIGPDVEVLAKPFRPDALLARIRRLLAESAGAAAAAAGETGDNEGPVTPDSTPSDG